MRFRANRFALLRRAYHPLDFMPQNQELFLDGVLALFGRLSSAQRRDASLVPHNAVCDPLNLGVTGQVEVSVYVHWMGPMARSRDGDNDWRSGTVNVPKVVDQPNSTSRQNLMLEHPFSWVRLKKNPMEAGH